MANRDEAGREAAVRARAFQLWVESGHADGYQDQHWRQAEREIAERESVEPDAAGRGAAPEELPRARDMRHSDGMSGHPSVLDPGPGRQRS